MKIMQICTAGDSKLDIADSYLLFNIPRKHYFYYIDWDKLEEAYLNDNTFLKRELPEGPVYL